jgi:hypothetical protein
MAPPGAQRVKALFHAAAGLSLDTNDVKRYRDFVDDKLYDLLLMAVAAARANGRDVLQPSDLPITKGLQECIHQFKKLAQEIEIGPILEELARHPPLDAALREDVEERLPAVVGGLSVALAQCLTIIAPERKNPGSEEWGRATRVLDLLL